MAKINLKKFKTSLEGSRGIISLIAQRMGTSRQAVYGYMEKHPQTKRLLEEEREKPFDMAESVVFQKLVEKDLKAAEILLLKHKKGRERGYGDHQEIEHSTDPNKGFTLQLIEATDKEIRKDKDERNKENQDKQEAEGNMESSK